MSADSGSASADIVRGRIRPPPIRKADRMQIGKPGDPVSHICQAYPDRVEVRGRDLCDDLMGRLSFTEYFHLLLTGDEPTEQQRYFLDLLLIAIAEHGMMPTSVAARMTLDADPGSLQGAVAAGILGCGPVVLGTAEPCARLLDDAQARGSTGRCRGCPNPGALSPAVWMAAAMAAATAAASSPALTRACASSSS
jgi:hypothetical protein